MRFPSLVMLEPFVFRRDDEASFPDDTKAPIRASATTSWGARFSIAFDIAQPPSISRLYAQLPAPGFLPPKSTPLTIVATHRHLALFHVATLTPEEISVQNFFIYRADKNPASSSSSLKALPPCTEPQFDWYRRDGRLPRRRNPSAPTSPRLLHVSTMGLWCRGKDEFVMAELHLHKFSQSKVFADICFLRSSWTTSAADDQLGGTWHSKRVDILCRDKRNPDEIEDLLSQRVRILCRDNPDKDETEIVRIMVSGAELSDVLDVTNDVLDFKCIDNDAWQLYCWETETVIPCDRWLCWIDFNRGILFCDLSSKDKDPNPTVSFLRFPLDEFPETSSMYVVNTLRGVSVVDDGRALKFIDVARDDGIEYGALKPGASFTITCHTLELSGHSHSSMAWNPAADYKVTSGELWNDNKYPEWLPRDILMYPQVDIDRPSVVHFLLRESGYHVYDKKLWVVSIDMSNKVVDTCSLFIDWDEGLETDDADWIKQKFWDPTRFLPCEFPKFFNSSSKRKHMG